MRLFLIIQAKILLVIIACAYFWFPYIFHDWAVISIFGLTINWFNLVMLVGISFIICDILSSPINMSWSMCLLSFLLCPIWVGVRFLFFERNAHKIYRLKEPRSVADSTVKGIDVLDCRYSAFIAYGDGTRYLFRMENEWEIILPRCKEQLEMNPKLSHVELEDRKFDDTLFSVDGQLYIKAYQLTLNDVGELNINKVDLPRYEFPENHKFEQV